MTAELDHVQVAAPSGCEAAAREFYGRLLGLDERPKPAGLRARGGVWFGLGSRALHIGVEPDFAPALKAHPALSVPYAELREIEQRLREADLEPTWDDSIDGLPRFFCADPWGNRLELLAARQEIIVMEGDRRLAFSFEEMLRFNGGESPGGVAYGFKLLEIAGQWFGSGGPLPRRALSVRTAFGGPGTRDAFELVTRATTDRRYLVDATLARPELGRARQRFVFAVECDGRTLWLTLNEGFVSVEFVDLAGQADRSALEQARLDTLKAEMAELVMATPAAELYATGI